MKNLSCTLIELYEAAEHVSINAFPHEVIRLMRGMLQFDGAVLGLGDSLSPESGLHIDHVFVHAEGHAILEDYGRVSIHDPIAKRFLSGMRRPLRCAFRSLFKVRRLPAMEAFIHKHGLRQLMLFGTVGKARRPQWIVMFRGSKQCFTRKEGCELFALWPHVERTVMMNRSRHLERQLRRDESRAAALVNHRGFIEAADPRFHELLSLEWPSVSAGALPPPAINKLFDGSGYEGTRIRISAYPHDNFVVCKAYERNLLSTLTPAELAVARQFSGGLTHKDVALKLGVSQNTVRTHIKHVYDKLAIHSKARLVQLMAMHPGQ